MKEVFVVVAHKYDTADVLKVFYEEDKARDYVNNYAYKKYMNKDNPVHIVIEKTTIQ